MPAAATVNVFGCLVMLVALGLLLVPGWVLGLVGAAAVPAAWVRIAGALAVLLGYYYIRCAHRNDRAFFEATVPGRFLTAGLSLLLVLAFDAPPALLAVGAVDLFGALWTRHALRYGDDVPR